MISVFEGEENITKCGNNDLVCCKDDWFVPGPGGSYDNEVIIQTDHPNYCGIFAEGSCQRRQSCGNIGTSQLFSTHKGTFINDVPRFLAFFDLPTYVPFSPLWSPLEKAPYLMTSFFV